MVPLVSFAQNGNVTGTVKDASGEPLIGVNVIVQGSTIGTVSDIDGNFTLSNLPQQSLTVEASFIGYIKETYVVDLSKNPNTKLAIVLVEDIEELSEVVVIGYGTQKKSDLTSAVASVSAEDLDKSRSANISNALQGRVAGVKIATSTGAPGAAVSVQIRGITSINSTDPLWIIDGVGGDPNSVNASDIESMEILKDASAAAIYGANAGSGVILITTKKGKAGKTQVTFNANVGVQNVTNNVDLATGPEFIQMYHEYQTLANSRTYYSTEPDTFQTYDYQDMIFRQAVMKSYDIGASGGTEKSTFYLGASYVSQEGVLIGSSYDKITARVNGEHQANDWLAVGINSSFASQTWKGMEDWELKGDYANPILAAIQYHDFVAPYGEKSTDSEYDQGWSYTPLFSTMNPLATLNLKNYKNKSNSTNGTLYAKVTPFDGFTYESRINGGIGFGNTSNFVPIYFITTTLKNDESTIYKSSSYWENYLWQNIVSYNKTLFDVHNVSLLVGTEVGESYSEYMSATRKNLVNQTEEMWYFDASQDASSLSQLPTGSGSSTSGNSYFGRISYDYKSMILFQANFRRDGSSLFGSGNRWGNFPSVSAGFKFTELDVVKNMVPFLNFGKIRAGWGKVGNNTLKPYVYYATVSPQQVFYYNFSSSGASVGSAPTDPTNENIKWETVVTSNVGLDLTFFESKLSFSFDWFKRFNEDMIMYVPPTGYSGFPVVYGVYQEGSSGDIPMNVGEFINKGVELSLGWKEKRGAFSYSVSGNCSFIKTEVGDIFPETLYQGQARGIGNYLTRIQANSDFEIFYGYQTEGLFRLADTDDGTATGTVINQPYTEVDGVRTYAQPDAKPGDFRYKDVNNDGKINSEDMVSLGSPHPSFTYGFSLSLDYELPNNFGQLDLNAFFQGEYGKKILNATKAYLYNTDGSYNWASDYYNDHYTIELYDREGVLVTEANDNASNPRIDPLNANSNLSKLSDFYIESGDYFRMKNLEIGYTFPQSVTNILHITRLRFYGSATNLFTITKYSGLDPEVGISKSNDGFTDPTTAGIDRAAYPTSRMFSLGINVTF